MKSESAGRAMYCAVTPHIKWKTALVLLLTAIFFNFAPPVDAGLCALCKKALEESGNAGLIHGFYWSILLIGGVPLILMGAGGYIIRRAEKKRR